MTERRSNIIAGCSALVLAILVGTVIYVSESYKPDRYTVIVNGSSEVAIARWKPRVSGGSVTFIDDRTGHEITILSGAVTIEPLGEWLDNREKTR